MLTFCIVMKAKTSQFDNSIYRLVIRNIQGYGTFQVQPKGVKRAADVSLRLDVLKQQVLDHLLQQQNKRTVKPINWSIAWEVHSGTGLPHLDILIVFQRNIRAFSTSFDYLIKDLKIQQRHTQDAVSHGHVWVTPYSPKKLNKAILDYGQKQDPSVISNLSSDTKNSIVRVNQLKVDPYGHLYDRMKEDPLHFNVQQYVQKHDLSKLIRGWSSIKNKLKDMQGAAANLRLKSKPGFRYIDRSLIQSKLSSSELKTYDSWSGYQTIVNHLNQMILQRGKRQMKTLNLLITGPPSVGKTSLFSNPNHKPDKTCVQDYCAVYPMGMNHWFPKYLSDVYHMILWNQAKLTSYSYDVVLKLLQGSYLDLPHKGGSSRKVDNPLIVMTSNMTLDQMIVQKFGHNKHYVQMARRNLAVRVQNVVVPDGYNLFLLQKLLCI